MIGSESLLSLELLFLNKTTEERGLTPPTHTYAFCKERLLVGSEAWGLEPQARPQSTAFILSPLPAPGEAHDVCSRRASLPPTQQSLPKPGEEGEPSPGPCPPHAPAFSIYFPDVLLLSLH